MKTITVLIFLKVVVVAAFAQSTVYEPPVDYPYANDFKVKVNDKESFVYDNRVAAYTSFNIDGKTTIEVQFFGNIYEVDIRPKNLHINPRVEEGKIIFTLTGPCNISVEVNKNLKRPLFVFANPPETNKPMKDAPNVHFFESGKIHKTGRITLKDNDIVYIEGGAIVKGSFFLNGIKNVHIYGYGILDGECVYEKG